ncbi:DUF481 domain-containing protein [Tellurirhabdus bombi]|uniref:DUF481 domain-containing protein n=1 Tax=Tellurirhabdus bombi TaxID=2907205 RepID=UPI001F365A2B|nr:DUF481 domain-containing protein [Tellurirhabdus bombi]
MAQNSALDSLSRVKAGADTLLVADTVRVDSTLAAKKQPVADTVSASKVSGFHYKLTADGTLTAGNVNRALIQTSAALDWAVSPRFRLTSNPTFAYGKQNNQLNERELFGDLRTTYRHDRPFYYLGFGSLENSNLRKITTRTIGGAGVGYKIIRRKNAYLSLTNVFLYENTNFVELADINVLRNSTRIFGEYQWQNGRFLLNHTVFLQPALDENNFRWNGNISLQMQLTARVGLRTMIQNSYESIVAPDRKRNDFRWTFGISLASK